MKRYDIHRVDFNPTRGAEMSKIRPAVVVSRDELNSVLRTITVCPLTTNLHPTWRTRIRVELAGRGAEIAADQIRTISVARVRDQLGSLDEVSAAALRRLLTELYGE
jgi:mRNA interferase MazF